jgi:hypothetical protein
MRYSTDAMIWTVGSKPTTVDLDTQIYKVVASLHDIPRCKVPLANGGHVFRCDIENQNDRCIALARQYLRESVCTIILGISMDWEQKLL